jgi:2-hydroxychromene-2-carboxylate isomerase
MPRVTWYFDFVSPYAYFGLRSLNRLPAAAGLRYEPVLLAGLLNHWGQKGPAEIPPKRVWTYRACIWWAQQNNVAFRMPAAHPFNSLPYLRLSIAAGNSPQTIRTIFEALWTTGVNPADSSMIAALAESLGIPPQRLTDAEVKNALRENTEKAAQRGVFGVPSLCIDEQVFWGNDSVDFAAAYLLDPGVLATEEMNRANSLPIGASRA